MENRDLYVFSCFFLALITNMIMKNDLHPRDHSFEGWSRRGWNLSSNGKSRFTCIHVYNHASLAQPYLQLFHHEQKCSDFILNKVIHSYIRSSLITVCIFAFVLGGRVNNIFSSTYLFSAPQKYGNTIYI